MLMPARVRVFDIPYLDAPPQYETVEGDTPYPQIRLPSGHVAAHLIRYEDVRKVLADTSVSRTACNVEGGPTFLPGPTQKELLLNLDMPDHARSRLLVTKDFSPRGVESVRRVVEETANRCISQMLSGERPADLFQSVLQEVTVTAVCEILGIPFEDHKTFRRWSQIIQVAPRDNIPGIEEAVKASFDYLMDFVRGSRKARTDGFIRRQVDRRRDGLQPLSDEEIVGVLLGILLGGDHNCLSVMTKCVYTLLCAPLLWQKLVDEPARVSAMIEELIRVIPIGKLSTFPRIATQTLETSVGRVPAGTPFYANVFLANRDPEAFPDPLTIDPDRRGKSHIQFGVGIHSCMGFALARLEIAVVLNALLQHVPSIALDADPASLRWINGTVLRRPDQLPIRWNEAW
jgi:cytochrome P450